MKLVREIDEQYTISNKEDVSKYVDEFRNEDKEYFIVLGLDTAKRVTYREVVSIGILNSTLIHPREVFKKAITNSSDCIILVHNHPSGSSRLGFQQAEKA